MHVSWCWINGTVGEVGLKGQRVIVIPHATCPTLLHAVGNGTLLFYRHQSFEGRLRAWISARGGSRVSKNGGVLDDQAKIVSKRQKDARTRHLFLDKQIFKIKILYTRTYQEFLSHYFSHLLSRIIYTVVSETAFLFPWTIRYNILHLFDGSLRPCQLCFLTVVFPTKGDWSSSTELISR